MTLYLPTRARYAKAGDTRNGEIILIHRQNVYARDVEAVVRTEER